MNCKSCGTPLLENETKCPNCGEDNSAEIYVSAVGEEIAATPRGFNSKRNIIIIVIAAILLIGGGITAIAVSNSRPAVSGVAGTLQLAERYLSEQNYGQAIIEFQKVLEIEPMNVDAYLGLADAYLSLGNTEKALETLRKGLETTGDQRLQDKIDKILNPPVSSSTSSISSNTSSTSSSTSSTSSSASSKPVESTPEIVNTGSVKICGVEYDIATTTSLNLNNSGITNEDLKQVAKLTNLTGFWLNSNQISDISPLAGLTNLIALYLNDNQISDVSPLAGLTNLTYLSLSNNQINDITPLAGLTNLTTYLGLGDNQISNLTPLAGLTNLTILHLWNNQISDNTPLAGLTNLTELNLDSNQISDENRNWLKGQLPNCDVSF